MKRPWEWALIGVVVLMAIGALVMQVMAGLALWKYLQA